MRRVLFAFIALVLASSAFAQSNSGAPLGSPGVQMWPQFPPVGIGTELSGGPRNSSLHIHYDYSRDTARPAVLRFSQAYGAGGTSTDAFGLLGLIPITPADSLRFSSLIRGQDFVLRSNHGDLILTDFWKPIPSAGFLGGAIRMATRPDSTLIPPTVFDTDFERLTILSNGNVGIDLPPDTLGLARPMDQLQIGGSGNMPGLTVYGGNRWEGLPKVGGGTFNTDYRYISFNHYQNHVTLAGGHIQPKGASGIWFSDQNNGFLSLSCIPYDSTKGLDTMRHANTLAMDGTYGLSFYTDMANNDRYHQLFQCLRPGAKPWPITRNTNGLFVHHTPVLITNDTTTTPSMDFQNLPVRPNWGDDTTWALVVNGGVLAKEYFASLDWPDFVFEPSYKLRPLEEVEAFIATHHHLQDVPSAIELQKTGVPLGSTEAVTMRKVEELTLYVIELKKELSALTAQVHELKSGRK